jgi:hypothetical protein
MTIEQLLEQAIGLLHARHFPLKARFQSGVWLSPTEKFAYDMIPPVESFLRAAYTAFHTEQWDFDEDFELEYSKELTLARAIVKNHL